MGLLFILSFHFTTANATTVTSTQTGNWNTPATWVGGIVPDISDTAVIASGHIITVTANASVERISISANASAVNRNGIDINSGITLSVTNAIVMTAPTALTSEIRVGAGNLSAGSIAIPGSGTSGRNCEVSVSTGTITVTGSITFSGTAAQARFTSAGASTVNVGGNFGSGGTLTTSGTGTINFNGSVAQTIGTYTTYNNITINNTSGGGSFTGTTTIGGTLIVNIGTINFGAVTTTVTGATTVNSTLNITSTAGTKTFGDIVINPGGVLNNSANEAVTVNGNIQNDGTFTAGTGVYTLSGTGKTISGINAITIPSITVNGTYTNNITLTVGTALAGSGTHTNNINAILNLGGTSTITTLNAVASGNTVRYYGSTAQTVKATTYHHLVIDKPGYTATLGGNITINGSLTITAGAFTIGAYTISISGTTTITGTLNITSTTGTKTFGDIVINPGGVLNNSANEAATVNGNIQNDGTFTAGTGVYTLSGTGKTISGTNPITIANLTINTPNSYTNNTVLTVSTALSGTGSFTNGVNATLNIGGTSAITTLDASATGNTVNYNSTTAAQTIKGTSYYNLIINKSGQTGTLGGNTTVNGVLSLQNGTITTSTYRIIITSTGNILRTNGHINGNLQLYIAEGQISKTFEIGDASNYTPVEVSFGNVTNGGDLTAKTTASEHPNISSSYINPLRSVNRYWTISNSGIVFDNYSATFNFVTGDIDPGSNTSIFHVGKEDLSWSYPTVGTKTGTSTQATGITSFSDFAVGESLVTQIITATASAGGSISPSGSVIVNYGANQSFTITPNTGYHIDSVLVDGVTEGVITNYNFTNVIANHTISAYFSDVSPVLGWLSGWIYRKSHIINSATGAGTNYQVKVKVYYGNGTDSGENVYLGSKCRTDFGDVRFTDDDQTTLLNYWIQEKVDNNYAIFWVEVADNLGTASRTIYTYYGNVAVTTTSNGYATFVFFDDFEEHNSGEDPDGWTDQGTENFYVALHDSEKWFQVNTWNDWRNGSTASSMANIGDAVWSARIYYHQSGTNAWGGIGVHIGNGNIGRIVVIRDGGWHRANEPDWSGASGWMSNTDIHFPVGTKGRIELITNGTNLDAYWYNPSGYNPEKVTVFTGFTIPSGTGKLDVHVERPSASNTRWIDADDIIVRKYVSPEPSHGIWGSEDTLSLTITATAAGGGVITPSGLVNVKYGTNQLFTINPNTGYHLDSLVVDGINHGSDSTSYAFVDVDDDHSIDAYFSINTYTITATASSGGTISPAGVITLNYGDDTTFIITPNTGYHLDSLVVDNINHGDDSTSYTFYNVSANHTITAFFSINTYTLTVNIVGSGTVTKTPDQLTYNHGTWVVLQENPATGWHFMGWSGDLIGSNNPDSVYMEDNKTVTATFAIDTFNIVSSASSGGTISPLGTTYVTYESNQLYTFGPNTGYHLDSLVVDDVNHGDDSIQYQFISVTADHTIRVYYSINTYTLTVNTSGSGGVTKTPEQVIYNHGTWVKLQAIPVTGWHFINWTGNLTGSNNPDSVYMDDNKTITANFAINTYTLNVTTIGLGTVTKNPNQPTYDHGTNVILTAIPGPTRVFLTWSGDTTTIANPITLTMNSNNSITATFVASPGYRDVAVTSVIRPNDTIRSCSQFNPQVTVNNQGEYAEICTVDVKIWRYCIKLDSLCRACKNPFDSALVFSDSKVVSIDTGFHNISFNGWHPIWSDIYWINPPQHHVIHATVRMAGDQVPINNFLRKVFFVKARNYDLQVNYVGFARGSRPIQCDTVIVGAALNLLSVVSNSPYGPRATFRTWLKIKARNSAIVYSRYVDRTLNPGTHFTAAYSTGWVPVDTGLYTVTTWLEYRPGVDSIAANNSIEKYIYARRQTGNTQSDGELLIRTFKLLQNYSPSFRRVSIIWQIPIEARVIILIYDATGRRIKTLVNEKFSAGTHYTIWDCKDNNNRHVSMGVYYIKMSVNSYTACKKIVVMR